MKHYDVLWGEAIIDDADVCEIINHASLKRLKNIWISTYGYLYELKRNSTRYEHSLGVYLLLRHFGATKEEQISGLIHDVAHTALSHVSTYAFQGKYTGIEFHELQQEKFIHDSGLASLLKELKHTPEDLLHEKKFTLLENDLPDICADRLDYALRDGLHLQILTKQQVNTILRGIKIREGEFVFGDVESAYAYSFNFYLLNLMHYGSPTEAHFNIEFGALVKYAIDVGVLEESDWFTDDIYLTNKLRESSNTKIQDKLAKFNNKLIVYEDTENPDVILPKKIRVVDPKVAIKGKLRRLSELSKPYKELIDNYSKNHKNHELPIKVVYRE